MFHHRASIVRSFVAVALAFSGVAPPALRILDELARLDSDDAPLRGRLAVVECLVSSYAGDLPAA